MVWNLEKFAAVSHRDVNCFWSFTTAHQLQRTIFDYLILTADRKKTKAYPVEL
jgi:hypothetical protein